MKPQAHRPSFQMPITLPENKTTTGFEVMSLVDAVAARIPSRVKLATKLMMKNSRTTIHEITVESVMSGMRGLPCVLWEVSQSDENGVRYHGKSLSELEQLLPKWPGSDQISPEAMLWFLYTAAVPTRPQLERFTADLISRSEIPTDVQAFCDSLSPNLPPTTQMIMTAGALSPHSKFSAAIAKSVPKNNMWKYALEDALDATALIPMIAARIHSNIYRKGWDRDAPLDTSSDLAQNFATRMGRQHDLDFIELIRLYWALHMDHGANVSAHTMRLCSSALADAFLSLSAGLIAGTGTLHAMAIKNAVEYNRDMLVKIGPEASKDDIERHISDTLAKGHVVPGYGHAMLRGVDPRFELIVQFVKSRQVKAEGAALLDLVSRTNKIIPEVLRTKVPRMKNPAPNVDALSGCVMHAYGIETEYLVVVMACSRGMGFMAQYVWDRALGIPLERPLSVTMDEMLEKAELDWA